MSALATQQGGAPGGSARVTTIASLPHAVLLDIFARLPVDARARCAVICRSWRTTLAERSLWTRLNLKYLRRYQVTDALLRGAAARAGGGLEALDATGCLCLTHAALLAVANANAGALRELHMCGYADLTVGELETMLHAAPLLRTLDAGVRRCSAQETHRMLRNEPPFQPFRLRRLDVDCRDSPLHDTGNVAAGLAFAADVAAHAPLEELTLDFASCFGAAPTALDALVDAVVHLRKLEFSRCMLTPACAASLARLLSAGALSELRVTINRGVQLLDHPGALLLADALRTNSTLTCLELTRVRLWEDAAAAAVLLDALTGHNSLISLDLSGNAFDEQQQPDVARALGALVSANAAALTSLILNRLACGDAGYEPLFEALPRNTHLRALHCFQDTMSEAFLRERVLPALHANSSLRQLHLTLPEDAGPAAAAAREAQALVRGRR
jgi:hypothetical protein